MIPAAYSTAGYGREMSYERFYFDTLRRISRDYLTVEQIKRNAERKYGIPYQEALELAYENMQLDAADVIKGKRRPRV